MEIAHWCWHSESHCVRFRKIGGLLLTYNTRMLTQGRLQLTVLLNYNAQKKKVFRKGVESIMFTDMICITFLQQLLFVAIFDCILHQSSGQNIGPCIKMDCCLKHKPMHIQLIHALMLFAFRGKINNPCFIRTRTKDSGCV